MKRKRGAVFLFRCVVLFSAIAALFFIVFVEFHHRRARRKMQGLAERYHPPVWDSLHPLMAEVPRGSVLIGKDRSTGFMGDRRAIVSPDERWAHWVNLPAFAIGVAEVTNREYFEFMKDGGYADARLWSDEGWRVRAERNLTHPVSLQDFREHDSEDPVLDLPVHGICYHEAVAYCNWLSRKTKVAYRLPTEEEWEKAAIWDPEASKQRIFPWGDSWDDGFLSGSPRCNWVQRTDGFLGVSPICFYDGRDGRPDGRSYYGCCDMAGNVLEWTSSTYVSYSAKNRPVFGETLRVIRGGAQWDVETRRPTGTARIMANPDSQRPGGFLPGFRLCTSQVDQVGTRHENADTGNPATQEARIESPADPIYLLDDTLLVHNGLDEFTQFFPGEVEAYPVDAAAAALIDASKSTLQEAFKKFWEKAGPNYILRMAIKEESLSPPLTEHLNASLVGPLINSVSIGVFLNYHDYDYAFRMGSRLWGDEDEPETPCPPGVDSLRGLAQTIAYAKCGKVSSRSAAILVLRDMGSDAREAVPTLLNCLRDEQPSIRKSSAQALVSIDSDNPSIIKALCDLLTDPYPEVRRAALRSLGKAEWRESSVADLVEPLRSDENANVRLSAQYAFLELLPENRQEEFDLTPLLEAARNRDMRTRWTAIEMLGDLAPRSAAAIPLLMETLEDEKRYVRLEAAISLGRFGVLAEEALPHLRALATREEGYLFGEYRQALLDAIQSIERDIEERPLFR